MTKPNNPLLIKFATCIRDLMEKPEAEIILGRTNRPQDDFETDFITVDELGAGMHDASSESWDGDAEIMKYDMMQKTQVLVEFYGNNAYAMSRRLPALLRSQAGADKKMALGITIFRVSSITDIKHLTGQTQGNRIQAQFTVQESQREIVETKRIEIVEMEILTEKEKINVSIPE